MIKRNSSKTDDTREKLLKIIEVLKEHTSSKSIKIPKNYPKLFHDLYKYIKPEINYISVSFDELEEIDREKQ
jgi:hypothetical protein